MKTSRFHVYAVIFALALFSVFIISFPSPIHDLMYGSYVNGYIVVTANHSGTDIVVTSFGGPDLDNTLWLKVINNNSTYNPDKQSNSTLSDSLQR